jgi:glycosyltransferase involved in cell wall biosynthesis
MKIRFITPYPYNHAPSQRFRFEQYLKYLQEKGIQYSFSPCLDEQTWKSLYSKGFLIKAKGFIKGLFRRIKLLVSLQPDEILFIHREAFFIGPPVFEYLLAKVFKKKFIFDFDDAIWLLDVSEANKNLAWLKSPSKTGTIIKYAFAVTAGNAYLAEYARKFNNNVHIIPTTIDTDYHKRKNAPALQRPLSIGWTGTSTTIKHFNLLVSVLKKLKEKYGDSLEITVISDKHPAENNLNVRFIPWSKDSEIEDLQKIDIGIMPLPNDQWAKGKCGFKGLQYMALEIPAVMSPVGVNTEIIEDGVNGFLAGTEEEWLAKLSQLIESSELRAKLGKAGRETVEKKYSVNAMKNKYVEIFQKSL